MLDLFAAMLSGGLATHQIPPDPSHESGISQLFLALDPTLLAPDPTEQNRIAEAVVASLHAATPADPTRPIRYPGEQTLRLREENLRLGVPVDPELWQTLLTDFPAPPTSAP
jgi:3-dehydro-L-gulonate 2-dehydrogenase